MKIILYNNKYLKELQEQFYNFSLNRKLVVNKKHVSKEKMKKNLENLINKKEVFCFILLNKKKVEGFIIWEIKENKWIYLVPEKSWHILYLFTSDFVRWKGWSTLLKNEFIKFINSKKITKISLLADEENKLAIKIYEKWGFIKQKWLFIKKK